MAQAGSLVGMGPPSYRVPLLPDSLRPAEPLARCAWAARLTVALAPPAVLIGYGLLTRQGRVGPLDSRFDTHNEIQEHFSGFRTTADDYLRYVPTAAVFGLSLAGVPAQHDLVERVLLLNAANLLSTGLCSYLKHAVGEARPYDSTNFSSFPSYHTTQAFTGATVLLKEYGGGKGGAWIGGVGYVVAGGTGTLRLLNNRHWISDVMVGAGLGILSTELVYALYPIIKRKLLHGRSPGALLMPARPEGSKLGVGLVWVLR